MTTEEFNQLLALINTYRDCFAANILELGTTSAAEMKIKTISGAKPVSFRPYRVAYDQRTE